MPRYYFHLFNSMGLVEDEDGRDLPNLDKAREEAVKGIRSVLSSEVLNGQMDLRGRIEIADRAGKVLLTINFDEAVGILPGDSA